MGSDVLHQSQEELMEKAQAIGLELFVAEVDELFIDYDFKCMGSQMSPIFYHPLKYIKKAGVEVLSTLVTQSPGGNTHIYIKLSKGLPTFHRIALQAAMGSDPIREVLSSIQAMRNLECPIAFFETKDQAVGVTAWREFNSKQNEEGLL